MWLQTSLVEKHVERILSLESALRQRDNSLQKLNMQLHSKDMQYLQLHAGPDTHSKCPLDTGASNFRGDMYLCNTRRCFQFQTSSDALIKSMVWCTAFSFFNCSLQKPSQKCCFIQGLQPSIFSVLFGTASEIPRPSSKPPPSARPGDTSQLRDVISPVIPESAPRPPLGGTCLNQFTWETSRKLNSLCLMWRSSDSTLSPSGMTEILSIFLRLSSDTLSVTAYSSWP